MKQIRWFSPGTLFLTLTPILSVLTLGAHVLHERFSWWLIVYFVFFYYATGLSITGGYHRLFSHKAYEASWPVRLFYLIFGAGAFQWSLLQWASDHRLHHRHVDTSHDPYNINKGFWYAHLLWMMTDAPQTFDPKLVGDLLKDPLVVWQHRYYVVVSTSAGLLLPMAMGWFVGAPLGGLAVAGFIRVVAVHHFTFFVNSLAHFWGSQTYTDKNTARDNFFVAILTYGEGYHNFHHYFQYDYRNGIRWYQFDPTKWLIKLLSYLRLAWNLKMATEADILLARMRMEKKRLQSRLRDRFESVAPTLQRLQDRYEEVHQHFRKIAAEHKRPEFKLRFNLKAEMEMAQLEYRAIYAQWRTYTNYAIRFQKT